MTTGDTLLHIAVSAYINAGRKGAKTDMHRLFTTIVLLLGAGLNFEMENNARKNVYRHVGIDPLSEFVLEAKNAATKGSQFQANLREFLANYKLILKQRDAWRNTAFFSALFDLVGVFTHQASRYSDLKRLSISCDYAAVIRCDLPLVDQADTVIDDDAFKTGRTGTSRLKGGLARIKQAALKSGVDGVPTLFTTASTGSEDVLLEQGRIRHFNQNNPSLRLKMVPETESEPPERSLGEGAAPPPASATDETRALRVELAQLKQQLERLPQVEQQLSETLAALERMERRASETVSM